MTRPILAVLSMTALACHGRPAEEIATAEAVPVEVAVASLGTVRAVVRAAGTVEPAPGADWTIVAPGAIPKTTSGKLQRFLCREGLLSGRLTPLSFWAA